MQDGSIERLPRRDDAIRNLTMAVYILQIVNLFGIPGAIVGVIINYVKRDEARDTLWESHFSWQIRTFWWALLGAAVSYPLVLLFGLGLLTGALVWCWYVYRIVRGFLAVARCRSSANPVRSGAKFGTMRAFPLI